MAEDKTIRVECYSGARYGERPLAFVLDGQRHIISEIIQQWRLPTGLYFRVLTRQEIQFDLVYHEHEDEWKIFPMA